MIEEQQLPTGGIFYCRDSAEINGCVSLQTSSWFDSAVLRNRQQKHTAKPLWATLDDTPTDQRTQDNERL
jgi:hypothetical protein